MDIAELDALDANVANACGHTIIRFTEIGIEYCKPEAPGLWHGFSPTRDPRLTLEMMERFHVVCGPTNNGTGQWWAEATSVALRNAVFGANPAIAICKAIVSSKEPAHVV